MTGKRVRHHVNPLGFVRHQPLPRLSELFPRAQPLEVDVGCMHGTFLLASAERAPDRNFLGLEIRRPLVREVEERIVRRGLTNAAVLYGNANLDWPELFPGGSLSVVHVHFPDPWFKKRHWKRRVFNEAFLAELVRTLEPGGRIVFMTDYAEYAREAVPLVEVHPALENVHGPGAQAPPDPARVRSHREEWHEGRGDPIHRFEWRRRPG